MKWGGELDVRGYINFSLLGLESNSFYQ